MNNGQYLRSEVATRCPNENTWDEKPPWPENVSNNASFLVTRGAISFTSCTRIFMAVAPAARAR
eukprot:3975442-Pyramimonas_sp.AAC.1